MRLNSTVSALVISLFAGSGAYAAPVDANAVVFTDLTIASSGEFWDRTLSGATTLFDTQASTTNGSADVSAKVDLATGTLGTSATVDVLGTGAGFINPIAVSEWLEFLTFSDDATISFSIATDGRLKTAGASDVADSQTFLDVYDVTDQANVFDGGFVSAETLGNRIYSNDILTIASGTALNPADRFIDCAAAQVTCITGDSVDQFFDTTLTGSLDVIAGRTYMFSASLFSGVGRTGIASGSAQSDFFNTARFAFDDLGGSTFTSSSGTFLSAAPPAPVPLPSGFPLLLGALAGLAFLRGRKQHTGTTPATA